MATEFSDGSAEPPSLDPKSSADSSRRRLLRGGLAGAPVLLSLASRSALAGGTTSLVCTAPSSFASINASRNDKTYTCSGRTPGYWKQSQHFSDWPSPYIPSCSNIYANNGALIYRAPQSCTSPTKFDDDVAFGSKYGYAYAGKTLVQVLSLPGGGQNDVARHIVAALLNVAGGKVPAEVMTVSSVKNIWNEYVSKGYYEPTAGIKWYASDISTYLKSTMPV